jgi:hypothetical protein
MFECFTVLSGKALHVNPPPGYFFLSSAPAGFVVSSVAGGPMLTRVLVTWRKALNETDPGPAPPATAAGNVRPLKPAKKASKRAPGRR